MLWKLKCHREIPKTKKTPQHKQSEKAKLNRSPSKIQLHRLYEENENGDQEHKEESKGNEDTTKRTVKNSKVAG
jgi:hypothetical protein